MSRIFIVFAFMLLLTGCGQKRQPLHSLEAALNEAANNRIELQKVLTKYSLHPKDSLKLKSAIFLITNMPGHYYYVGESISNFSNYFKSLKSSNKDSNEILDSISRIYGNFDLKSNEKRYDIQTIDSAYLCENIELAFDAWQKYPWTKGYSFQDFCECILPYRIGNEKLTNWRSTFLSKYEHILINVKSSNPIHVAKLIRDSIIHRQGLPRFTMRRPAGYPTIDALSSMYTSGACADLAQFAISVFRSFGIAACEDIMPIRGDANVGHSWVGLIGSDGDLYNSDFFGEILYVSETMINRLSSKPKVVRKMFSFVKNELGDNGDEIQNRMPYNINRSIDVTKVYSNNLLNLQLLKSKLYKNEKRPSTVYLCAPSWRKWTPVAWGKFDENGNVNFKDVECSSILRVAYFDKNRIKFLSAPFFVHRQTKETIFIPDAEQSKLGDVTLYAKFNLNPEIPYRNLLVGGVFEAANNKEFSNPDTLFVIKKRPFRLFTEISLNSPKKYRFFRYKGRDSTFCNIAEIEAYSENEKVEGKIVGTVGTRKNNIKYEFTSAFDGLTETSFDHSTPSEGWTGMSFNKPTQITKILYAPKNNDNYIKVGNEYELFVSTSTGWSSLGRKTATSDSLNYSDVPKSALFYLKNHAGGQDERVFLFKDGNQTFR